MNIYYLHKPIVSASFLMFYISVYSQSGAPPQYVHLKEGYKQLNTGNSSKHGNIVNYIPSSYQ